ncbi:interleukin-20 receptor subunit alpha isoform X2 [Salarias fasciatus]|uniref:Uncharacterized LOC115402415 n=1 Tax=Salarias fasciatus TaxID=181472 RepID=A0A672HAC6_SALFA|nr:uncharacterized protein LOC115402415 isoform X2 [Salarias fasciatus]
MWAGFIFLIFWGLPLSVSIPPPGPVNVSFSSVNLRNVLHWSPGINTPDDTLFTVEYSIYGDSIEGNKGRRVRWRPVQKCREIVRTWCDLSGETEDEEQGYHARVRAVTRKASSRWVLTQRRFDPKVDTSFGPPLVSVEVENNSAIITLKGPMRYQSKNHSFVHSMAAIYPQMTYNLSVNNTYRNQVHHVPVAVSPHKYRQLDYNTEYCFSARSRFLAMPVQCQPSAWLCIVTPKDPLIEHLQKVVVSIVVPGLCFGVIAVAGYVLHHYLTGKGQKTPNMLNSSYFQPAPATFPPEKPRNNNVSIMKNEPISTVSDPECFRRQQCTADCPPAYSPQNAGAHPEEAGDNLSVDYGFVAVAPTINEEDDEERERGHDEGNAETHAAGSSFPRSWLGAVGVHSPPVSPLQKSYQVQNLLQTCRETHTLIDPQAEKNTHELTSSALPTLNQVPSLTFPPGLFPNSNTDEDERHKPENQPLLSAYASQNIQNTSTFQPAQSDYLPDDYAMVAGASQETQEDDCDYEDEEEGGRICIDWDPETGKLVLPVFSVEERGDGFRESEEERRIGEDDVEAYVMKGELRLENVLVQQGSEEEEAERELERGGATGWEVDDFLSKWNLEISMGE